MYVSLILTSHETQLTLHISVIATLVGGGREQPPLRDKITTKLLKPMTLEAKVSNYTGLSVIYIGFCQNLQFLLSADQLSRCPSYNTAANSHWPYFLKVIFTLFSFEQIYIRQAIILT